MREPRYAAWGGQRKLGAWHRRVCAYLSIAGEEKAEHPTGPPLISGRKFVQSGTAKEEATYKVHQELYYGVRRCREAQASIDSRVLHILNRPGAPSMLRERIHWDGNPKSTTAGYRPRTAHTYALHQVI